MSRSVHPPRRLRVLLGLLGLGLALGALYGAEAYLAFQDARVGQDAIALSPRYIQLREHPPGTVGDFLPGPVVLSRSDNLERKRYRFATDAQGFIEPARRHAEPDLTLLFLGGSTTESRWVREACRFPAYVGTLLDAQGHRVNTLNAGFSGSNARHSLNVLLNKGLAQKPDVVLMMHAINDLVVLMQNGSYWKAETVLLGRREDSVRGTVQAAVGTLADALVPHLASRLRDRHQRRSAPPERRALPEPEVATVTWTASFAESLEAFVGICRAHGVTPVLMTQPSRIRPDLDASLSQTFGRRIETYFAPYPAFQRTYDAFNETIRRVGREQQVLVVDLAAGVPQQRRYFYDHVHLNDEGSELAARLIAEALTAEGETSKPAEGAE